MSRLTPLVAAALLLTACASDYTFAPDGVGELPEDEVAGTQSVDVLVSGAVVDDRTGLPVAGAEVCLFVSWFRACEPVDEAGEWDLLLPAETAHVMLEVLADGYQPTLLAGSTGALDDDWGTVPLETVGAVLDEAGKNQVPFDPAGGSVRVLVTRVDLDGFLESGFEEVSPAGLRLVHTGAGGAGPYYAGLRGVHDPGNDATSEAGEATMWNLTAGRHDFAIEDEDGTHVPCVADAAWTAGSPWDVRLPVQNGYRTFVALTCLAR